jgi:hypothetical protein
MVTVGNGVFCTVCGKRLLRTTVGANQLVESPVVERKLL